MGVHQFLSWLRARHNSAFRTTEGSAKSKQQEKPEQTTTSSTAAADASGSPQHHQQRKSALFNVATDTDYAVVCIDVNAMLHEVASSVTNDGHVLQHQQQFAAVEREILRRLGAQVEELVRIAGGDALKPRNADKSSAATASSAVMTRDVLVRQNPRGGGASNATDSTLFTLLTNEDMEKVVSSSSAKKSGHDDQQQQQQQLQPGEVNIADNANLRYCYETEHLLPVDVLLVVDGVAPLGKCAQQRERRAVRRPNQAQLQQMQLQQHLQTLSKETALWDANAITVGTPFMQQVCAIIHYTAAQLVRQHRNLRCFVSDASVPGEGEQKIFTALKCGMLASSPPPPSTTSGAVDDTRRICICSNDTDSIVMALLLQDDDLVRRPIDVWRTPSSSQQMLPSQLREHEAQQRAAAEAAKNATEGSSSRNNPRSAAANPLNASMEQQAQQSWVFDMTLFVKQLKDAFQWTDTETTTTLSSSTAAAAAPVVPNNSAATGIGRRKQQQQTASRRTFGGAMKSFAFMLSLFGGDFLPRVSDLSIADGDLDDLIEVLGSELFVRDKWIVDPINGTIDLEAALYCLKCLADRKYGVNVVTTSSSNNNEASQANKFGGAGSRRGRSGGISIVVGDGGDAFNPFGESSISNNNNSLNKLSATGQEVARQHELASVFWEGLVWVGRYFDGVTVSWAWHFAHPGGASALDSLVGGGSSAAVGLSSFGGAPRLRDLINDPAAITGRAAEMASKAAAVFQALKRGDYSAVEAIQRQVTSDVANDNAGDNDGRNAAVTPDEINPVAVGASVLPDVSWPSLLPRPVADELRRATVRWNTQRDEVQERIRRGESAAQASAAVAAAHKNNSAQQSTTESIAFEFIRSLKVPALAFNPIRSVALCSQLIDAVQNRFSKEEMKLLKKRHTYRLNWARVISPQQRQLFFAALNSGGGVFDPSKLTANDSTMSGEKQQQQQQQVVSPAAAAAALKAWNERVLKTTLSDVLTLNNSSNAGVATSLADVFTPNADAEQLPDFSEAIEFVDAIDRAVEEAAQAEEQRKNEQQQKQSDAAAANKNSKSGGTSSSILNVGFYSVPGAIKFTGTASAGNLSAFPTFSNTPVPVVGGGEAVMLQQVVIIPV